MFNFSSLFSKVFTFTDRAGRDEDEVNNHVRGLSINNPFYSAVARSYSKGVAGTGFNIRSNTGDDEIDRIKNKAIKDWSKKGNCDVSGRFHFAQSQRIMAREYAATSGGYIIAHHYNKAFKYGYKFELIPLSRVDTGKSDEKTYNGIEMDKWGKITAIHLFKTPTSKMSDRVPYKRLTLNVNPWVHVDQYSGVSPSTPILEALEYIDSYKASEMEGAKQRADNPIIVKTPMFKVILEAAKKAAKLDTKGAIDLVVESFEARRLDKRNGVKGFTYIAEDEDVIETGKAVDTIYDEMYQNEIKGGSAAIGLTASSTAGFMSSSYNEALRGVQSEEEEYRIVAQDIVEGSLRQIIEYHLMNGMKIKGLLDVEWGVMNGIREVDFIRATKGHIDPVKTEKATTEAVKVNGTKTMQTALAENGTDLDTHLRDIERYELEKLAVKVKIKAAYEKAGVVYSEDTAASTITDNDLKDEE